MLKIFCMYQAFERQHCSPRDNSFIIRSFTSKETQSGSLIFTEIRFFFFIFLSSKEQSFITLSLLISHKTIGGSLWLTWARIQLLVDDSQDSASLWGAPSFPSSPLLYSSCSLLLSLLPATLSPSSVLSLISFSPRSSLPPSVLSPASFYFSLDAPLSHL